jgi:hypothetical protein
MGMPDPVGISVIHGAEDFKLCPYKKSRKAPSWAQVLLYGGEVLKQNAMIFILRYSKRMVMVYD